MLKMVFRGGIEPPTCCLGVWAVVLKLRVVWLDCGGIWLLLRRCVKSWRAGLAVNLVGANVEGGKGGAVNGEDGAEVWFDPDGVDGLTSAGAEAGDTVGFEAGVKGVLAE